MKNAKLFTHDADVDGNSCRVLIQAILKGYTIDTTLVDYNDVDEKLRIFINSGTYKNYSRIFITDVGITKETAKMIDEVNKEFTNVFFLIDHHDTNEWLNQYAWADVYPRDENGRKQSATKLLYKKFESYIDKKLYRGIEEFVNLVSDYDTYLWKEENNLKSKKINTLFRIYGRELFTQKMLQNILNEDVIKEDDSRIITLENMKIERYLLDKEKEMKIIEIDGFKVAVTFVDYDSPVSDLGNYICEKMKVDVCAMIKLSSNEISYRSTSDKFHLGRDFASMFGGGGHDHSAGSNISDDDLMKIINQIFMNKKEEK